MGDVVEGKTAPAFSLEASTGGKVSLKDLKGKTVVLYFYPKDMTSGCTTEACAFRDLRGDFEAAGVVVLGVSPDDLESHEKFVNKENLNFPLLSDPGATVAQKYGVWKEKSNYGRTYMGIERTTFAIDGEGVIRRIWPKVKVAQHADKVLEFVRSL